MVRLVVQLIYIHFAITGVGSAPGKVVGLLLYKGSHSQ